MGLYSNNVFSVDSTILSVNMLGNYLANGLYIVQHGSGLSGAAHQGRRKKKPFACMDAMNILLTGKMSLSQKIMYYNLFVVFF